MKIAIIGAGIAGLTAAYLLNKKHQITVYEAGDEIGGHTATKAVCIQGKDYAIDTGFIVFNHWTYPKFKQLLKQLKVEYQPTQMGFSVCNEHNGLEYSGNSLNSLFAQRRNLLRIRHWRMLWDIARFNKEAVADLEANRLSASMSLGEYLTSKGYSTSFTDNYLLPMAAAIWSANIKTLHDFPLLFFVRFFKNHGLLSINNRPQWYVIKGGSCTYLQPLVADFADKIGLDSAVSSVVRQADSVRVTSQKGDTQDYDQVIIATHSDQALALLDQPSPEEASVLGAIAYQTNDVVLHTDRRLLPQRQRAWASWNYRIKHTAQSLPVLTYHMNSLQGIEAPVDFCVTLNDTDNIEADKILGRYHYAHPVFNSAAIKAQQAWPLINGVQRTWFCGAYWGNGFHEDGVNSALTIVKHFGLSL
ncbi:MAG: FAD-dependent oxidoreductase [Cellvibrionaceae bacterium]|nr:FAD-dependent oxidoreductase [Cellvibrionaceae bacterium]